MDETEYAIEAHGLRKSYGAVPVLDGIGLEVPRGEVFALLGPNGAGKTTTVRILATLDRADAGQVRVAGHDVVAERALVRRRISLTGQYAAVDEQQTGAENLRMMARLTGLPRAHSRERAAELLDRFGLTAAARRRVSTYSGGMRRRLDIAAGLVGSPEVLFLDEPTTGLDLHSRHVMWEAVERLAASGVTVFLTTQYLEEADRLADRIAVLDGGRLVARGTAAELKRRFADHRLDLTFTDAESRRLAAERYAVRVVGGRARDEGPGGGADGPRGPRTLSLATDGSAAHVRALLDEIDPERRTVSRFELQGATLDDVFLALTGHPAGHRAEGEWELDAEGEVAGHV
ncbi:ATP-binding cassette domain-containing protein [Streptomyces armeniacus]|uniref:ABC-type xenobiotic transporter n=1 Tax=Streptomyces armeniacus TaxID=83291 RepID=A0A345XNF4_9ACTN|nr:ATP-binding cassette domain-containing protein [Streptomyces armeniacus]AXK33170.1 ATP-binding cassette domain-containing protein [Streptomyces armeniacus]